MNNQYIPTLTESQKRRIKIGYTLRIKGFIRCHELDYNGLEVYISPKFRVYIDSDNEVYCMHSTSQVERINRIRSR